MTAIRVEIVMDQRGVPIARVTKDVDRLTQSTKNATRANKDLSGAQQEASYKQSQGVRGTAAAGRSMSKLTQTIGSGPNGLVGAYATLAANAFAVSASFDALRNGAQVAQIMNGLELQGARTGRSLSLVSKNIETITQGALSGADAMRAAALGTSAGLSSKDLSELTEVATNASLVLGRNIPDSMDRIIKGVTKLEPELLDELGLMTKLTEASENYARANGKSAASLTNMEKRLAFVESIKAEGTLKYDGVAEELGTNNLDKLAAAFTNLLNTMTGGIATSGALSAAIYTMTDSSFGLYGALTLLGAYIARQYTDHLRNMAGESLKVAAAYGQKVKALKEAREETIGTTKATLDLARADSLAAKSMVTKSANVKGKAVETAAFASGATIAEQQAYIKQREASNARYEKQLEKSIAKELELKKLIKAKASDAEKSAVQDKILSEKQVATKTQAIEANSLMIESMQAQIKAQEAYNGVLKLTANNELRTQAAAQGRLAQGRAGLAMEAAAAFKLNQAYRNVIDSTRNFGNQTRINRDLQISAAQASGKYSATMLTGMAAVGRATDIAKVSMHGLSLGVKSVGIAFATALPWIGVITVAFSMAESAYNNFIKSDVTKKKEKALEDLETVLQSITKSTKEFEKVQNSANLSLGDKTLKALTIQTNAMVELTNAYVGFADAADLAASSATNTASAVEFLSNASLSDIGKAFSPVTAYNKFVKSIYSAYVSESPFLDRDTLKKEFGLATDVAADASMKMVSTWDKTVSLVIGGDGISEQNKTLTQTIDSIATYDKALAESIEVSSDTEKTQKNIATALAAAQPFWEKAQLAVQNFAEAVKTAETAQLDFLKSISVTTKFDNALSAFSSLSQAITEVEDVLGSNVFEKNSIGNLLAGIGPAVTGVLPPETQNALKSVKQDYATLNIINKELYELQLKGITAGDSVNKLTKDRKALEDTISSTIKSQAKNISSGVEAYKDRLRIAQLESVTLQGDLAIQQAQLEVIQRRGAVVASDLRNQINAQNGIKETQAKILEIEISFTEQKLAQQRAELGLIDTKLKMLEVGNQQLEQSDQLLANSLAQQKSSLETMRTLAASEKLELSIAGIKVGTKGNSAFDPIKAREYGDQIKVIEERLLNITDPVKRKATLDTTRKEILESIALSEAQVTAARQQVEAVRMTQISGRDRDLMAQELTIKNASEVQKRSLSIKAITSETLRTNEKINNVLSNRISTINEEVRAVREQSLERQNSLAAEAAASIAELMRQRDLATETKAKQELETRINLTEEEYKASVQLEQSKTRLEIIQKAINISIEDGINAQKDGLAVLQKQADLSQQIVSANIDIASTQARIAAKRAGTDLDPVSEFILNKKAAEAEYNIALQTYKLRLLAIDSEYDLLEAQRIGQAASLKSSAMLLEATLVANGGVTEAQQATIDSVNNAANMMESRNYNIAREQAKQVERLGLERLRLAKEEASIFSTGQGSALGGVLATIGTVFKEIEMPEPMDLDGIKIVSPEMSALKEAAEGQLSSTQELVNEIRNAKFSDIALDVRSIASNLRTTEDSKAAANIITQAISASSKKDMANIAAKRAIGTGLSVTELKGYGKGLTMQHQDPGHAAGTAFDLSGGTEAKIQAQVEKAVMEGAKVIWKRKTWMLDDMGKISTKKFTPSADAKGDKYHDRHAHISFQKAMIRGAESAAPAVAASTQKAVSSGAEKAVTAKNTAPSAAISERNLVVNDVSDISDIVDKNILSMGKLVQAQLPVKLGMKEYGLIAAATFGAISTDLEKMKANLDTVGQARMDVAIGISNMMANLGTLVPQTMEIMTTSFEDFKKENEKMLVGVDEGTTRTIYKAQQMSAAFAAAAQVIAGVSAILQSQSNAKIATIDKEIAAEQKRDGKSAASVEKLQALEKKKDSMARKAFNTNKKLMMAQAVMSTASAVTGALALLPNPMAIPLAVLVGAMGAAQLAIIAGTSYEGSASSGQTAMPSTLSVGKRSDTVDLARGPNANAGGEVGFLRGSSGSGSNAGNYNTVGSAYGGELMRGYGNRGFVVGEKGPEIITPETPISVTPTNEMQSQQPLNATFNIQALDSSGVQDLLVAQKGNIIKMLREAANASGTSFMEEVNVNVYTRPNVAKL